MADISVEIIETNIDGEVVDGDTIEATVSSSVITSTLTPLTEVDPVFLAHDAFGITAGDITLLTDLTALALTDGNFIVADGANWVAEAGDTARTSLGLGTGDSPTFTGLTLGGVDISTFIDQDVSSGASPTFDGANFTSIPDGALSTDYVEVAGDTMTGALVITPTANSTATLQVNNAAGAVVLNVNTTNGRVGIGTLDPAGVFHSVAHLGKYAGVFQQDQATTAWTSTPATFNMVNARGTSGNYAFFTFSDAVGGSSSAGVGVRFVNRASHYGDFLFYTKAADGYNPRFYILSSGDVAIGANFVTPQARLHIKGSVDNQQLIIQANATQTANVIEQQQSGGTVVLYTTNSGALKISDKLIFTQTDGNEYIDSLADGYLDLGATTAIRVKNLLEVTGDVRPTTDDTYYLGLNDDDSPQAWKGVILKDTTDGKYYRIEVINGVVTATDLTD